MEVAALCAFAFLAGLIDAVAGGGGLIQVPALFAVFPSIAPPILLGTNKFSSITGTTIAALRYGWSIPVQWRVIVPAAGIAGIGALLGAKAVTVIDPATLRPILLVLLSGITVYTLARPKFGEIATGRSLERGWPSYFALSAIFGFYDGFFGPGAGSLVMFGLVRWFGYDFLRAAATTKILNLASNLGALILFLRTGNVLYAVALPMAAFNIAGAFLGSHFAVRIGSRLIRWVFLVVVAALVLKVLADMLKSL
jgi:uncharacterized membrane protein YfcA